MVQTRRQLKREKEQEEWLAKRGPLPSGYTFVDEFWRTHTISSPPRYFTTNGTPTRPAPATSAYLPPSPYPTHAERAAEQDLTLWATSASVADYEARKRTLIENPRAERAARLAAEPSFPLFASLPPELRHAIWRAAIAISPVQVRLTNRGWSPPRRPELGARCGTVGPGRITDYSARATLPAVMLVNREAHGVAGRHYRRAFRGLDGRGGVTAGWPTELVVDNPDFQIARGVLRLVELSGEDWELVSRFTVDVGFPLDRGRACEILLAVLDKVLRHTERGGTHVPEIVLRVERFIGGLPSTQNDPAVAEAVRKMQMLNCMRRSVDFLRDHPDWVVPSVVVGIEYKGRVLKRTM